METMPSSMIGTICLFASLVSGLSLPELARRANSIPTPLSVPPTTSWEGIDGSWNTFAIRIGTPPQVQLGIISTTSQETWVVHPGACDYYQDKEACGNARGGMWYSNKSSTYAEEGIYEAWIESNLDLLDLRPNRSDNATVLNGYDSIGLGYIGEGMPTLDHQVMASVKMEEFWLGHFGIHPKTTNLTSFNQHIPSYLTTLYKQSLIPSVSWGYTAGAPYRYAKVGSSLTLGGYDKSRFIQNNLKFNMYPDNDREFLVYINSITVDKGSKQLLPTPIYSYMDSTVAEIWLPKDACNLFEREFGLTWDNTTKLYFVSDSQHDALVARNANVTFSLTTAPGIKDDVKISLPYAAFDLIAKAPYRRLNSSRRYFPLRRAENETQYTLGRTFFQEAYLIANWERENFYVSQCAWLPNTPKTIVPIVNGIVFPVSLDGHMNKWVTAGIAVGVILLFAVLTAFAVFLWRNNRKKKRMERESTLKPDLDDVETRADHPDNIVLPKHELDASEESTMGMLEKEGHLYKVALVEAPENVIYELAGDTPDKAEADSRELSEKEAIRVREQRYNGIEEPTPDNSPISPLSPGTGTNITNISAASEGGTLSSVRSPISPMSDGTLVDGQVQPTTKKRINPADVQIVDDGGESAASERAAKPTPGELLEGSNGWSQLPERAAGTSEDRQRFSFEK